MATQQGQTKTMNAFLIAKVSEMQESSSYLTFLTVAYCTLDILVIISLFSYFPLCAGMTSVSFAFPDVEITTD